LAPGTATQDNVLSLKFLGLSEEPAMHKEGDHVVETPVEARAGFLDRPVLVVLLVSTALVVGGFALGYLALG
jgi:hypothetical protein